MEPPSPKAIEQARLELSVAAASTERTNRPRIFVVGAILLLVMASIYALSGLFSLQSARLKTAGENARIREIEKLIAEYRKERSAQQSRIYDQDAQVGRKLEELMSQSGLSPVPQVGLLDNAGNAPGAVKRQYSVSLTDRDPALLLRWLDMVMTGSATSAGETIQGLEIDQLSLVPGKGQPGDVGWSMDVRFSRWERR
jgi:hypothetical protein